MASNEKDENYMLIHGLAHLGLISKEEHDFLLSLLSRQATKEEVQKAKMIINDSIKPKLDAKIGRQFQND